LFSQYEMPEIADYPATCKLIFKEAIENDLLLTVYCAESLAGFALLLAREKACHLEQMSVDPAFARRSLGSALLEHAIKVAATKGFEQITLSTFKAIPWNEPFYRRFGSKPVDSDNITGHLLSCQNEEAKAGLDMTLRVLMFRALP